MDTIAMTFHKKYTFPIGEGKRTFLNIRGKSVNRVPVMRTHRLKKNKLRSEIIFQLLSDIV